MPASMLERVPVDGSALLHQPTARVSAFSEGPAGWLGTLTTTRQGGVWRADSVRGLIFAVVAAFQMLK